MSTYKERLQASIANLQNQTNTISQIETVINSLPDRHNDIMLFETIEEMNAYPGAVDGTLAVIYRNVVREMIQSDNFTSMVFPEIVVLDEAFSREEPLYFYFDNGDNYFSSFGSIDAQIVEISMYNSSNYVTVKYESEDGITYTRTVFENDYTGEPAVNPVKFEPAIHYGEECEWDSIVGKFIQVSENVFDGMYRYIDSRFVLFTAQFDASSEQAFDCSFYGKYGLTQGTLQQTTNLNASQVWTRRNIRDICSNLNSGYYGLTALYNNDSSIVVEDMSYLNMSMATVARNMFHNCINLTRVENFVNADNLTDTSYMFKNCYNLTEIPNINTTKVTNMEGMLHSCYNISSIPMFDTSNAKDFTFLCYNLRGVTNIPEFNTVNVVNMYTTFGNCTQITNIPNFDMSKVNNMALMFTSCTNLISVPNFNTANVRGFSGAFHGCTNLVDLPQLNSSNINSTSVAFAGCNNLSNASIQNIINMMLNSNVTDTKYMNLNPANSYSIFNNTKFNSSYYSNRLTELTQAGWKY